MSRPIDWEPTPPWMEHAACKGMGSSLFFPKRGADPSEYEQAREVCRGCPVRPQCAEYAIPEKHGVWGALSERERRPIRAARRRAIG